MFPLLLRFIIFYLLFSFLFKFIVQVIAFSRKPNLNRSQKNKFQNKQSNPFDKSSVVDAEFKDVK